MINCRYLIESKKNKFHYCNHPNAVRESGTTPYCVMVEDFMLMFGKKCPIMHEFVDDPELIIPKRIEQSHLPITFS